MPGSEVTLAKAGGKDVATMIDIRPEFGPMPRWAVYFAADDVDAKTEKAKSLGAEVMVPPQEIPNIGRFAIIRDPQGAIFSLFKGA
jgi:predicted enzyme related to lactoylglutathione lyase